MNYTEEDRPQNATPATANLPVLQNETLPTIHQYNGAEIDQYYDRTSRFSATYLLFTFIALMFIAAAIFEIDQSVRAIGEITPKMGVQIVQAADGGIVSQLLVEKGDIVEAGQIIAVLDKGRIGATYKESDSKVAALKAQLTRALAEAEGKYPVYTEMLSTHPEYVKVQFELFNQRRRSLDDELDHHRQAKKWADQELKDNQSLYNTGDASRTEVLRAKQKVNEIEARISAAKNKHFEEARQEVSKAEAEYNAAVYQLQERESVLGNTNITAPVTGIIQFLNINTVGGVLRQGDEFAHISPTESGIIVTVEINPVDIGQVDIGMPVQIKLDTFDFTIYGSIEGRLSYISSDTITEQRSGRETKYYVAQVEIDEDYTIKNRKFTDILLKQGLTVSVDILAGKRTVLHYLTKPIQRAFSGSMHQK